MKLSIEIRCDNSAFEGADCGPELARILRRLADDLNEPIERHHFHGYSARLLDANGNRCGEACIS